MIKKIVGFLIAVPLLTACFNQNQTVELYVPTAASITDAMEELIEKYTEDNETITITPTYSSSGDLKDQIKNGAPADIFLSAAMSWMIELEEEGFLSEFTPLLRNELVLITNSKNTHNIGSASDLMNDGIEGISIGDPETVPAGEYAKQALTLADLYNDIKGRLIFANDVRGVLTYVETGNVDAGFVYQTDAMASTNVTIIEKMKVNDPVLYPIGLLSDTEHPEEAKAFYEWLKGDEAKKIFKANGFEFES
ncbi:molybdate ABC transporter substrate-binding protein [Halalkalibacter hemicellulosilyticus]|uniref:Molybdenum ABC transporter n=1 Tax=Halalkalibacter hemicellulosilyticusJCM 9152 TaxID=1236971 RepID=W4QCQ9_9BACI|nr:molybdate ABC transporter substrate-binding protein [Halalkalibacter hemicellulosilyticus]GAE29841.1 molybdenum ABC transporter [Halalkalibacter hemicellulosilyticusJCM 9152]